MIKALHWKSEINYLGVVIASGVNFKCNIQMNRQKFFRALNCLLAKIGRSSNPSVIISLLDKFCVPVLLYGLEAIHLRSASCKQIDRTYYCAFAKIYKVVTTKVIQDCQY